MGTVRRLPKVLLALCAVLAALASRANALTPDAAAPAMAAGAFHGLGEPSFGILSVLFLMALLIGLLWRDARLLLLAGVCLSGLLALLYADGLAWRIEGLSRLGASSMALVFFAAAALYFAHRYGRALLDLSPRDGALARVQVSLEALLVTVCVAAVLLSRRWEPAILRIVLTLGYAGAGVAVLAAWWHWLRTHRRSALLVIAAWSWLIVAVGGFLLADPGAFWRDHGVHLAVAGAAVLLGVGYVDDLMRQRERDGHSRRPRDGRRARVERSRRDFAAEVNRLIDELDPNLYEEAIMARFLEYLSNMVPVAAAAVVASHRGDVRLVVVGQDAAKDGFESVLATREQLLQSVCLSDRAAVIHSDDLGVSAVSEAASCLGIVPLRADNDEWSGVLLARSGDLEFGLDELQLVHDFAHQAYAALRNAQQFRKVRRQAETDALTEVLNRRAVLARGRRCFKKHQSLRMPMSLLFIDIDFFKRVNDRWGHQAGDAALRSVASICSHSLRDDDFIGRYGGEEFLAVLPGASAKEAQLVAERLRAAVEAADMRAGEARFKVTVSVGISELSDTFCDLDTMLRAADRALYRAKREGRNRVVHHRYMLRGDRITKPFSG